MNFTINKPSNSIYIDGERGSLKENPLISLPPTFNQLFTELTANQDDYRFEWEVVNSKLYLRRLQSSKFQTNQPFPSTSESGFASWFTGSLEIEFVDETSGEIMRQLNLNVEEGEIVDAPKTAPVESADLNYSAPKPPIDVNAQQYFAATGRINKEIQENEVIFVEPNSEPSVSAVGWDEESQYEPEATASIVNRLFSQNDVSDLTTNLAELGDRTANLESRLLEFIENGQASKKIIDYLEAEVRRLKKREDERNHRKVIMKIVTVKDRLDQVVQHFSTVADDASNYTDLYSAVKHISEETREVLLEQGAAEFIPEKGSKFDAAIHEASKVDVTNDANEDLTITNVSRAGYRLSDNVIRPSMVTISKYEKSEHA